MGQRKATDFTFSDSQHTKKKGDQLFDINRLICEKFIVLRDWAKLNDEGLKGAYSSVITKLYVIIIFLPTGC